MGADYPRRHDSHFLDHVADFGDHHRKMMRFLVVSVALSVVYLYTLAVVVIVVIIQ